MMTAAMITPDRSKITITITIMATMIIMMMYTAITIMVMTEITILKKTITKVIMIMIAIYFETIPMTLIFNSKKRSD